MPRHQPNGKEQHGHRCGQGGVAIPDNGAERSAVGTVDEGLEFSAHVAARPFQEQFDLSEQPLSKVFSLHVREVGGQHKERLDQRENQHAADDGRHDSEELAHESRNEEHGPECRHGGQDGEGHGNRHLARALNCRFESVHSLFHPRIGGLANHDRVVHNHA